jgi:two-component system response regulator ChvI
MRPSLEQNAARPPAAEPALIPSVNETKRSRALLVEDSEHNRETLADELSKQGFIIRGFRDGASLLRSLHAAADADVIILDWRLPKPSGIDLLLQLRERGVNLPVVFLIGRVRGNKESLAIDIGAIDWNDRSRGAEILVKRLKCIVGSAKSESALPPEEPVVCGKLVLDPKANRACWRGKDVGLTLGEYRMVHLLGSNAGRYLSYRVLYDQLHYEGFVAGSGEYGYRANVRSVIRRIRHKFRELDPTFLELQNYTGFGYCWRKPV